VVRSSQSKGFVCGHTLFKLDVQQLAVVAAFSELYSCTVINGVLVRMFFDLCIQKIAATMGICYANTIVDTFPLTIIHKRRMYASCNFQLVLSLPAMSLGLLLCTSSKSGTGGGEWGTRRVQTAWLPLGLAVETPVCCCCCVEAGGILWSLA